jgi:hypothetical protein
LAKSTGAPAEAPWRESVRVCAQRIAHLRSLNLIRERLQAEEAKVEQTLAHITETLLHLRSVPVQAARPDGDRARAIADELLDRIYAVEQAVVEVLSLQVGAGEDPFE